MERINEKEAARKFVGELLDGKYPLERSQNCGVDYGKEKDPRDTEAVKRFVRSELFAKFKDIE